MALLLQFLPILVFTVVDAFVTDARISIGAAVAFAVVQLGVTWWRTRRFDWFLVVDVALIGLLGGISIAFEDELFFKLKPAILEGLSVVLILALVFAPEQFLLAYFSRLVPGRELPREALRSTKRLLLFSCGLIALHVVAVVLTAELATKETWALVSGPGFYVLFAPMFGLAWWQRRRAQPSLDRPPAPRDAAP